MRSWWRWVCSCGNGGRLAGPTQSSRNKGLLQGGFQGSGVRAVQVSGASPCPLPPYFTCPEKTILTPLSLRKSGIHWGQAPEDRLLRPPSGLI